jgi:hypothetical protein
MVVTVRMVRNHTMALKPNRASISGELVKKQRREEHGAGSNDGNTTGGIHPVFMTNRWYSS